MSALRIAFFGSDSFSVQALSKLVHLRSINPSLIAQIDVITRSVKPQGRKRVLTDIPIGVYTSGILEQNYINLHRADSQGEILDLLGRINPNLAIAVSYGKLVPLEFIGHCKYGGLNVHPSFLPRYSGSSPVQYALINDDPTTGVTVQTLHPTKFDKGDIIAQSEPVPIEEDDNYASLLEKLGNEGSELLVKVIENKLYVPPVTPLPARYPFSLASKILPSASQVNWETHTNRKLKRLYDTFGSLHTYKSSTAKRKKSKVTEDYLKVMLDDVKPYLGVIELSKNGQFWLDKSANRLIIKTIDGAISVGRLKMQYCDFEDPIEFIERLQKRSGTADIKEFIYL